jgi:DNA-binding IclR family transcriptional regulator
MNGENNSKIITSAQKCLQILKYLAYANEELNINQLAEAMDINKSSMHHYLSTLVVEGFLVQNPQTKKYRIGPEAMSWRQ